MNLKHIIRGLVVALAILVGFGWRKSLGFITVYFICIFFMLEIKKAIDKD